VVFHAIPAQRNDERVEINMGEYGIIWGWKILCLDKSNIVIVNLSIIPKFG
jgi:hypothetical protein